MAADVARLIRRRIFTGGYPAGSYIRLDQLAAELGQPVRGRDAPWHQMAGVSPGQEQVGRRQHRQGRRSLTPIQHELPT